MKKKSAKKKVLKKTVTKKEKETSIVVRVETPQYPALTERDIATPEVDGGKYMLPKTWVSEKQVMRMLQQTPRKYVYRRPGRGGQTFEYVTGTYVKKVLNFIFGWNWDFEIMDKGREGDQVWVQGKLTVKDDRGRTITKMQFGRADIKFLKNSKTPVDYGNDLKAAATDALKKCAADLGIASDIYGKEESAREGKPVEPSPEPSVAHDSAPRVATPASPKPQVREDSTLRCQVGAEPITQAEFDYSMRVYGKALCREHQKGARRK